MLSGCLVGNSPPPLYKPKQLWMGGNPKVSGMGGALHRFLGGGHSTPFVGRIKATTTRVFKCLAVDLNKKAGVDDSCGSF